MKKKWIAITSLIIIAVVLLCALVVPYIMRQRATLGLTIRVKDVTPTSATLECVRGLGFVAGSVENGSAYTLERETSNGWEPVPTLPTEENIAWTMEANKIPFGLSQDQLNYGNLYGELSPGTYRVRKAFFTYREGIGSGRSVTLYAEFVVE